MMHICVMSFHKPIRIYMGGLILGVNTLYRLFCFFKLFSMVGKRIIYYHSRRQGQLHTCVKQVSSCHRLVHKRKVHHER